MIRCGVEVVAECGASVLVVSRSICPSSGLGRYSGGDSMGKVVAW